MRAAAQWMTAVLLATVAVTTSYAGPTQASPVLQLQNEFVNVRVDATTGQFTMSSTGGDPSHTRDDNKPLLYGPDIYSSYTTVLVQDKPYRFGQEGGSFTVPPRVENGVLTATYRYTDGLDVKQNVRLVNGTSAAGLRPDVMEIEYELTNRTAQRQQTGVRVLLDTMLGQNDGAPFRLPGVGSVEQEREFVGTAVPNYWQAFDSLVEPTVVSQGTFVRGDARKPDKVQFASWNGLYYTPWNYPISNDYRIDDTAVAMTWNLTMEPGATQTVRTYYGQSGYQQDLRPPLGLTVAAEPEVAKVDGRYAPNPIALQAYISNVTEAPAYNAKLTVELPDGLYLIDQGAQKQRFELPLGTVLGKQELSRSFDLYVRPQSIAQEFTYKVLLEAELAGVKTMEMKLRVPALQNGGYPALEMLFGPAYQEKLRQLP